MVAVACSFPPAPPEDLARRDALVTEIRSAADGDEIDLNQVFDSGWDRLVIFGPYSDNQSARDELGFALNIEELSPWSNTEGGAVFVFAQDDRMVGWLGLPSTEVGVHCLYDAYTPSELHFELSIDPDGFRSLTSPARPSCAEPT
jgi:hypothetical protein